MCDSHPRNKESLVWPFHCFCWAIDCPPHQHAPPSLPGTDVAEKGVLEPPLPPAFQTHYRGLLSSQTEGLCPPFSSVNAHQIAPGNVHPIQKLSEKFSWRPILFQKCPKCHTPPFLLERLYIWHIPLGLECWRDRNLIPSSNSLYGQKN